MKPAKISNPDQVRFTSWNELYKHVKESQIDLNDPFQKIIMEIIRISLYDTLTPGYRDVIPKINRLKRLCKSDN